MNIRRKLRAHTEVHTGPLNDILFILLLFFLIASTLANPNVIKLTLPKAQTNETTNKDHLSLSVTEDKVYYLNKQAVAFEDLEQQLLEKTTQSNDKTVVIRIPADLMVQDLVDLMQIGVKLKLNFVIATQK